MSNERIKVVGYAQRQFFENGIEYRNYTPDLVGLQLTSDGGSPLFTLGNFSITTNLEPKSDKTFITNRFSTFVTLTDLNLTVEDTLGLLRDNAGVVLNLDKANLSNYALFGSLTEFVRVSLEDIITTWPASLYVNPLTQSESSVFTTSGYTIQNYVFNPLTEEAVFNVNTNSINNKFQLNFLTTGTIIDTFNATNDLRNLTINYGSYVVFFNDIEYPIIGFTGATFTNNDFLTLKVKGDVFSGMVNNYPIYHIKPNKTKEEIFFNGLDKFQKYILNRQITPLYTADFKYSIKSDNGALLYVTDTLTWPVSDGYNIDFDTTQYEDYATSLLDISTSSDSTVTNLMVRFLVTDSISNFDTVPVFLDELNQDTSGQKMNKALNIYGRSFDEINKFITGIEYAHTVTYDKNDNVPDAYLKNLAKVLGWDLVSSILENNLLDNYVTSKPSTYSGQTVGLTALEAESELWRRIILNTPWLWKSKGTRKAIEFLFRFIGAPNGLVSFNEYIYLAENKIDIDLFQKVLEQNGANPDLSIYPIDRYGYPRPLADTPDMYFQNQGLWHRETGGDNSVIDILTGNNPHVGPYDGGFKYMNQFNSLIPNFSAVTISSETTTTNVTNLFTNYNRGTMNYYSGATFIDAYSEGNFITDCSISSFISPDIRPTEEKTDCGCIPVEDESMLTICFDRKSPRCVASIDKPLQLVLNPKGNDGAIFYIDEGESVTLDIEFDYLINFNCNKLETNLFISDQQNGCNQPARVLENVDLSLSLDKISGPSLISVFTDNFFPSIGPDNLYNYLSGKTDSTGFVVCGEINNDSQCHGIKLYDLDTTASTIDCQIVSENIVTTLYTQQTNAGILDSEAITTFRTNISPNALNSKWLHHKTTISDPTILSAITNEKIKISIFVNNTCIDFCLLLDNVTINKNSTRVLRNDIFVSKSPSFDLYRIIDNKKSWLGNDILTHRTFDIRKTNGSNPIRMTDYILSDDRQIINSKELDLDISMASAIETDVWCYISDNPCLLTGITHVYTATTCTGITTSTSVSAATIVTAQTIVTASTIVTATTATTITTGTTTGYTCSSGFTLTGTVCYENVVSAATFNGLGPTIVGGNKNPAYGKSGTIFYSPIQYNQSLPVTSVGTTVKDQTGGTISVVTISNNTYWGTASMITGRLNQSTLSASSTEYLGISECMNLPRGGTYYIGMGSDNLYRLRINGVKVVDFSAGTSYSSEYWHVFPYTLNAGLNIFEFEGKSTGSLTAIGMEIYRPSSLSNLINATTSGASGTIYSTINRVNTNWDLGTTIGYSCPVNTALDLCSSTGATCAGIIRVTPSITAGTTTISGVTTITGTVVTTGTTIISGTTTVTGLTIVTATTITCCDNDNHCGDNNINFQSLLTEPLSGISSIEDFEYIVTTELIDAKDRQTISAYPTLKALYDRYMHSSDYCGTNSSRFDYKSMDKFAGLIGNYWVDLIEQVMPSTAIWGATKIYSNTIFDNQKFKYKPYSLQFGDISPFGSKVLSPCYGSQNVEVKTVSLGGSVSGVTNISADTIQSMTTSTEQTYNRIYIVQNNSGSEFIGKVGRINEEIIKECQLSLNVVVSPTDFTLNNGSATAFVMGNYGVVNYKWSTGESTQTIYNLSAGTYTLTVSDSFISGCSITTDVEIVVNPEQFLSMNMYLNNTYNFALRINSNAQPVWIDWGDGSLSAGTGTRLLSHVYNTPYTGPVSVNAYHNFSGVTRFDTLSALTQSAYTASTADTSLNLRYTTDELSKFVNLTDWYSSTLDNGTVRGSVANIPRTVKNLNATLQNNTAGVGDYLYGSTYELPQSAVTLNISASNIISGNTLGLPRSAVNVYIEGSNTISGDVSGLPTGTTYLQIAGNNTIGGDAIGLPRNLYYLNMRGNNMLYGSTSSFPTGITSSLVVQGDNTVHGPLSGFPSTLLVLDILGNNTISGSTYDIPRGVEFIELDGNNTVSGDVLGIPSGATFVYLRGDNTVSGKFSDVSSNVKYLQLEPCMISGYTSGKIWTNPNLSEIRIFPETLPYALSTAEVDRILIDLTGATFGHPCTIDIQGTSQPRSNSAQVLAALTILTGSPNNVVVTTN